MKMSWAMNHSKSQELSVAADLARKAGEQSQALDLFRHAAELETKALLEIEPGKLRTIGITYVSAASLWYKAFDYKKAEEIACRGLAEGILPDFACDQLREILQANWNIQLLKASGVQFAEGSVMFSVSGGQIVHGGAPLDLVLTKVDQVSKIYYRVTEMRLNRPLRIRGNPEPVIMEQCRPWLFQTPPGSYQFAVRIEKPKQLSYLPDETPEVKEIVETFLSVLKATMEDPTGELIDIVPDVGYRNTFLKLTKNLVPTGKTFEKMEVKPVDFPERKPIIIRPVNREFIQEAINLNKPEKVREIGKLLRLRGILKGLQLHENWIDIDVDGDENKRMHIHDISDVLDDEIGPMVNHFVLVDVEERKPGKYFFREIQLEE
jgi:hypothetical protein